MPRCVSDSVSFAGVAGGPVAGQAIPEMGMTSDISAAGWRETLDINLTGAFLGAKHQIPAMLARGGGSIIFTSTFVGHTVGFPGVAAYASSKAGLVGLTQVIAAEYGPQKIRANALICGGVDTPMGRMVANTPETLAFVSGLYALKRIAQPQEIANAAVFLASEASSFMTGTATLLDGGVQLTGRDLANIETVQTLILTNRGNEARAVIARSRQLRPGCRGPLTAHLRRRGCPLSGGADNVVFSAGRQRPLRISGRVRTSARPDARTTTQAPVPSPGSGRPAGSSGGSAGPHPPPMRRTAAAAAARGRLGGYRIAREFDGSSRRRIARGRQRSQRG